MVLDRETFFAKLNERVGDDTSEGAMTFLEDMSDTFNELEKRAQGDGEDWKQKYMQLDETWKARYKHRFFNGGSDMVPAPTGREMDVDEVERGSNLTFSDLFKKG